jgi:taurine dioxygenase
MRNTIRIDPVTPAIGAEVSGVALAGPLSDDDVAALRAALLDHLVLFFRDQDMTDEQHIALGRRFGALHVHPASYRNAPEGQPEILRVHADAHTGRANGDTWHSDVSCDDTPPMGSILRVFEQPDCGGDTLFASMYAAYDALSPAMKRYVEGMTATHDGTRNYADRAQRTGHDDPARTYPSASHPIVRTHPETGRKALYVNPLFTMKIDGVDRDESDDVLGRLFAHIAQPDFQCRFRWRRNSVAFWDNRCTIHHAIWDYFPQTRTGHRVTIAGDRPV